MKVPESPRQNLDLQCQEFSIVYVYVIFYPTCDTPSWKTMSFFILQFTLFDALCNGMSLGHKNARSLKRYGGHKLD